MLRSSVSALAVVVLLAGPAMAQSRQGSTAPKLQAPTTRFATPPKTIGTPSGTARPTIMPQPTYVPRGGSLISDRGGAFKTR